MTPSYSYTIPATSITVNGVIVVNSYVASECTIVKSGNNFLISNLIQKTFITTSTNEYILYPIAPIDTTLMIIGVMSQNAITLSLPLGPTYVIGGINYYGGSMTIPNVPAIANYPDLSISISNYNDGASTINIKAINAQKKLIEFVESTTISATLLDPTDVPAFITDITPTSFTATNINITSDVVIAKSNGAYYQYQFKVLPFVRLNQTLYFTAGSTYQSILPSYGYQYGSLNLATTAASGSVVFQYGETSGSITLVQISITSSTIYMRLNTAFSIWKYLSVIPADVELISITSAQILSLDGMIMIPGATSSITVNFTVNGINFSESISVYVISSNAIIEYMTSSHAYAIPATSIVLDGVPVSSSYTGASCAVAVSNGSFTISNLIKVVVITAETSEYILYPITPIDTSVIISIINQNSITLELPSGPTYMIAGIPYYSDSSNSITIPNISAINGYPDLTVNLPNYNDGTSTISVKAISAEKKLIQFVNSITITAVLLDATDVPTFITNNGASFTAINTDATNDVVIAKSSGAYYQYQFQTLPSIQLQQTLYFGMSQTYIEILPTYGYQYGSLNLTATALPGTALFQYGELTGFYHARRDSR